jgi:DNA-binding LytR/AlgR family response regulator
MKLRVLIVDDEPPARSELRYMLEKVNNVEIVGEASNAREAIELIRALNHDVVFLDIQMPGLTGLNVAEIIKELPQSPAVVFVTAFGEHAVKAFELDAIDYLIKPFDEKRLLKTINKVVESRKEYQKRATNLPSEGILKIGRIPVEKRGKTILLSTQDIIFVDTKDDYTFIHTYDENYITSFTLKELENRLHDHAFFRAHRGYIVNLHEVKEIVPMFGGSFLLRVKDSKESEIPVSRRNAKKLRSILGL